MEQAITWSIWAASAGCALVMSTVLFVACAMSGLWALLRIYYFMVSEAHRMKLESERLESERKVTALDLNELDHVRMKR